MDIERGNLEILFKKIPFEQIQLFRGTSRDCHTYDCVGKRLYLEYAKDIFQDIRRMSELTITCC